MLEGGREGRKMREEEAVYVVRKERKEEKRSGCVKGRKIYERMVSKGLKRLTMRAPL